MKALAMAPAKVILFGEHYVVYGAQGIAAAISPCNEIEVMGKEAAFGGAGFEYHSTIKENDASACLKDLQKNASLHPYIALYKKLAKELPLLDRMKIIAHVKKAWPLKGVGNSASLGAALSAGIRKIASGGKISKSLIFEDAQAADEVAHGGGRPSGIDAAAAAIGGAIEFQKNFQSQLKPKIKPFKIAKMHDAKFLLIDTLQKGEKRSSTAKLVSRFARFSGVDKKPAEMKENQRQAIIEPYQPIFFQAKKALLRGDWEEVGRLMDENQKLLLQKGVSQKGIEKAISICKKCKALGAKLSGAGGRGGVVISLFEKNLVENAKETLQKQNFRVYEFEIEKNGARAKII